MHASAHRQEALARTRAPGPFPERLDASPYDADYDEPGEQRPADDVFWARLRWCVAMGQAAIPKRCSPTTPLAGTGSTTAPPMRSAFG
ncbi:hypothetical protein [Streptomyces phaeoluteigriseus]